MCLHEKTIENRRYKANKKNGGVIPAIFDERERYVTVGCGRCMECMKKKSNNWRVRLLEELKDKKSENARFITLTFNTESIIEFSKLREINRRDGYERDNKMCKIAVRRFLERWRKKYKKSVRHWFVTEIGGGRYEHIHIHGIIFTNKSNSVIEEIWNYGYIHHNDYCNEKTINYIIKYLHKVDEKHKEYEPIVLCSQGMGKRFIERNKHRYKYTGDDTKEVYKDNKGIITNLPDYYKKNYLAMKKGLNYGWEN